MNITVNGIPIRNEELNRDIEITFKDLNSAGQRRLLCNYLDVFFYDALTSKYVSIQITAKKLKSKCSNKTLNRTIEKLLEEKLDIDINLILEILNIKHLELIFSTRKKLSQSEHSAFRLWVAKDSKTPSSILVNMFERAAADLIFNHSSEIFDAIILNPSFKISSDLEDMISRFPFNNSSIIMDRINELTKN